MVTIGQQLSKTRRKLVLNKSQMAKHIISVSFYSRVENNTTTISATNLIRLLRYHDQSIIKFMQPFANNALSLQIYESKINEAFQRKDITKLQQLKSKMNFKMIHQIINLKLNELEQNAKTRSPDVTHLKHDMLQIENWDANYLWVFLNIMNYYEFTDLEGLIGSIFNKYRNSSQYDPTTLKFLAEIAVNYLKICYSNQDTKFEMKKAIDFVKSLPNTVDIFNEKLVITYFESVINKEDKTAIEISQLAQNIGYTI
ncbi:helix-turn-helix domain-containing protein [Lactobacillus ultunensis]|uniref:HTH cro/C1-type domain-containing protein n=2 Tax=Lactobacillus ultunensis TaxID=227945 RepID=C2EKI1_9LACO|nr:helix-turn-helix transcriptional regulator [Lactobacillus ultunensis]EEJ72946.1 hypothetical protein HMPREF0548_0177 [Lactobacillus ultunensis DSM 16047]KRL81865.1 hypothetical protein FC57_GL000340 [Lactobacillus ultunensis DSM 16047]